MNGCRRRPTCKLPHSSEVLEKRVVNQKENKGSQHKCCPWRTRSANRFLAGKGPTYLVHEIYPGKFFVVDPIKNLLFKVTATKVANGRYSVWQNVLT